MANPPAPDRNEAGRRVGERFRAWLHRRVLARKLHWFIVVTCIVVGELLATALERDSAFKWLRNFAYQKYQSLGARKGKSVFDAVVLIDDDTYWKDRWTPRVPISRELLSELVRSVAKCNPTVIAVDIDLSTGDDSTTTVEIPGSDGGPGRTVTLHTRKDWGPETIAFLDAVESALEQRIKVVLTHEVGREPGKRVWTRFPNVYDGYNFDRRKPRMGHLLFDTDLRVLPLPVPLSDGSRVKSLAIAAAEAYRPDTWEGEKWDREVLTRLIDPDRLVTVSARELLHPKDEPSAERTRDRLQGKIVWIGGAWHQDGYGRGTRTVDAHATARGDLPGVLLHANYAESLLDEKLLAQGSTWLVEVPLALLIAVWLDRARWPWKWLVMLLLLSSPLILSYVGIQDFGLYFDVFVITFLLILGLFLETIVGWYLDHLELERIKRHGLHDSAAPAGTTQDS
jgi:CHASE2 domain-containing sensor protein